mmetsp:Transcript_5080/g.13039  ORF Transcript_5080/g.13039 Transcript_5080/m.13039 type:complete len:209 (-) Transcript_5080:1062-1688(-)
MTRPLSWPPWTRSKPSTSPLPLLEVNFLSRRFLRRYAPFARVLPGERLSFLCRDGKVPRHLLSRVIYFASASLTQLHDCSLLRSLDTVGSSATTPCWLTRYARSYAVTLLMLLKNGQTATVNVLAAGGPSAVVLIVALSYGTQIALLRHIFACFGAVLREIKSPLAICSSMRCVPSAGGWATESSTDCEATSHVGTQTKHRAKYTMHF